MKKDYLIGGLLGIVLCGIVAYAIMAFIGIQENETARQLAVQLPPPVPLEVAAPETRQAGPDQPPDEGVSTSGSSDSNKNKKPKTEGIRGLRISLKSGKVIIVDACTEFGSLLRCDTLNGVVEVEQQDIESINEITIMKRFAAEPLLTAGVDKKDENGGAAEGKNLPVQPGDGKLVRDLTPEQIKRLDEIAERKTVLKQEREKLIKEREQLHEDVGRMIIIRTQAQLNDLKNRIADLEAKIISFNDEVKKLNEEESRILNNSGNAE